MVIRSGGFLSIRLSEKIEYNIEYIMFVNNEILLFRYFQKKDGVNGVELLIYIWAYQCVIMVNQ